jgi:hypothetical protein
MNNINGMKLASRRDTHDESTVYWTDGKKVYYGGNEAVKGADIDSFVHYSGTWAVDKNNCYMFGRKIRDADRESFEALNYTYAKDKFSVWVLEGKIKGVDAESFEVCDDGKMVLESRYNSTSSFSQYGYGKDKNNVYYYDCQGKAKVVKGASPETFVSLNDGYFGYDDKNVFCQIYKLNKADPASWKKFQSNCHYSKDKHVYYLNRLIKEADVETFEVVKDKYGSWLYAKDKNHHYRCECIITQEKFEEGCGG